MKMAEIQSPKLMDYARKTFEVRTYGFSELALLYFPKSAKESASIQLKRWILRSSILQEQLKSIGFAKHQKLFTPKQVEIIVNHFGTP